MSTRILLASIIAIASIIIAPEAQACSCAWISNVDGKMVTTSIEPDLTITSLANYPIVFSGMPIRMELNYSPGQRPNEILLDGMTVTFKVHKVWIGKQTEEITVNTGLGGGDCGYLFNLGDSYLVFPQKNEGTSKFEVSICGRTKRLNDATQNLAVLEEYLHLPSSAKDSESPSTP